jgi:hypothetical protein
MNQPPTLIGLSGKAGSGKNTIADHLRDQHGYHQFAFATALKDVVGTAFAMTEDHLHGQLKEIVDPRWGISPREAMQWLGTDVLRQRWPDFWIRHLRQDLLDFWGHNGQRPVVVTDVRFKDEAEALRRMKGVIIRVDRPAPGALQNPLHVSETDLDDFEGFDHVLKNEGSVDDLLALVDTVLFNGLEAR